jgi:hypothetical protein
VLGLWYGTGQRDPVLVGGAKALLEMKIGSWIQGIVWDLHLMGPRGPLREIQPRGTFRGAETLGRPIVPMALGARRQWIFKGDGWMNYSLFLNL